MHGGKGTFPMADIHNDDARDLLALLAKSMAYPLANMFLGNAENGEVVLAINPMWAERFGAVFPDVADLQAFLHEHAWQPLELWPEPNREILVAKGRVGAGRPGVPHRRAGADRPDRVRRARQPARDRAPELRREPDAERGRPAGRLTMDPEAVAVAVDEVGRMLRADGGDLVLLDADPKTLRVRLAAPVRRRELRRLHPRRPTELEQTIRASIARRVPGRVRAPARRPPPLTHGRRRDATSSGARWSRVYQPVLRDVVTALERDAGIDSGTYSALAYLDQAGGRMRLRELAELMRVRYSQPGLSRLVQRMEADGMVERRVDPDDRRGTVVSLTPRRAQPVPARARGVRRRARRAPGRPSLRGGDDVAHPRARAPRGPARRDQRVTSLRTLPGVPFPIGVADLAYATEPDVSRRAELARADGFTHIDVLVEADTGALALPVGCPIAFPRPQPTWCSTPAPPAGDGAWDRTVRWWSAAPAALCEPWAGAAVRSIDDVRALVDAVPGVRFLIDTGHVVAWGGDVLELLPFAAHVQLRDARPRRRPGPAG